MKTIIRRTVKEDTSKQEITLAFSGNAHGTKVGLRSMSLESRDLRRQSSVTKEQLESLFALDGLTFRIVMKYLEKMFGAGYILKGGTKQTLKVCRDFCDSIDIIFVMATLVKDCFVTGNGTGWMELGYTENDDDIVAVKILNPKSDIGFQKDKDEHVIYDNTLRPRQIQLGGQLGFPKMTWEKETITKDGSTVWSASEPDDDGRDRIAYFNLIEVGENERGMSPLEPIYKAAIIRMNLEDTVGNSAFRASALAAYVGSEAQDPLSIPDELLNKVKDQLVNVDQDTVWAFRRNVELKNFPSPDVQNYESLMYYFADLGSSGAGIGISLILTPPSRGARGQQDKDQEEFMDSVTLFQNNISYQIREQIFKRLLKAKDMNYNKAPNIIFRTRESGIALSTSRRLATYARYKLIQPDNSLEAWIREQEGLPPMDEVDKPRMDD